MFRKATVGSSPSHTNKPIRSTNEFSVYAAKLDPRRRELDQNTDSKIFAALKKILIVAQVFGLFPLSGLINVRLNKICSSEEAAKDLEEFSTRPKILKERIHFKWTSIPTIYTLFQMAMFALITGMAFSDLTKTLDGASLTSPSTNRNYIPS
jgi:hypothetical protein